MLAVKGINEALEGQDPQVTLRALQNPAAQLPQVMNNAGQLYHFEFRNIKAEKQVRIYRYNYSKLISDLLRMDNMTIDCCVLGPSGAWGNHRRSNGTHRTS